MNIVKYNPHPYVHIKAVEKLCFIKSNQSIIIVN